MIRTITRIFSIFLSTLLLFSIVSVAHASTRASDFFAVTEVWATPQGNGKFIVEFDIGATHKMSELGAKAIYIWEEQSNGDYEIVRTYSSGLIDTNTDAAYRKITYYGDSGTKYYATVALYAKDSSGSETLYSDTRVITA